MIEGERGGDWVELRGEELPLAEALAWVVEPSSGAVASFIGTVRDHAEGRHDVSAIDYEAYEPQVVSRLEALAADARRRWPDLGRVVLWHRVGSVRLGEASVAVVVSAPHRGDALEACRYLIDTLKATVPIWKREHWPGGAEWSPASQPLREIGEERALQAAESRGRRPR